MLRVSEQLGDWVITGRIEREGAAELFLASHRTQPDHQAELLLSTRLRDETAFRQEVALLAGLRHPALPRVLDWGTDPVRGLLWVALAPVPARSLAARMAEGPMDLHEARAIFVPVAEALALLHDAGMGHGALRPELISVGEDGEVRLEGLPHAFRPRVEGADALAWRPPEAFAEPNQPEPVLDRFALGLMLYQALSGQQVGAGDVGRLRELRRVSLDPGGAFSSVVRRLVRSSTSPHAARRPATTDVFAQALLASGDAAIPGLPEDGAVFTDAPEEPEPVTVEEDTAYAPARRSRWPLYLGLLVFALWVWWWVTPRQEPAPPAAPEVASVPTVTPRPRSPEYRLPASWLAGLSARTRASDQFPASWSSVLQAQEWTPPAATAPARARGPVPPGVIERDLPLASLLPQSRLQGIWASMDVQWSLPPTWQLTEDPLLILSVKPSPALLPDVSVLGVWSDDQPAGSFFLDAAIHDRPLMVDLPLVSRAGAHTIRFAAYHRSELPCERAEHPGLFTDVLDGTVLRVRYRELPPELDLSSWATTMMPPGDPDPYAITVVVPDDASPQVLLAAGTLMATLGRETGAHPASLRIHQGSLSDAPTGHLIVLAEPGSGNAGEVARLVDDPGLSRALVGEGLDGEGALALGLRPGQPYSATLAVIGVNDAALVGMARMLSSATAGRLPHGKVERYDHLAQGRPMPARQWRDTLPQQDVFTLRDLGLTDLVASGFHGGSVEVPLAMVPDEKIRPGAGRLSLIYGTSAQIDPSQSHVRVFIDGFELAEVHPLGPGVRHKLLFDLPVEELGPESTLRVQFDLHADEGGVCLGSTHDPLWGTLFADTTITLPRDRWSRLHNLGLLRYGAYPFGLRADFSDTIFVLPRAPSSDDIQVFGWIAQELGRRSRGDRFAFDLNSGGVLAGTDRHHDLVVIDSQSGAPLLEQVGLVRARGGIESTAAAGPVAVSGLSAGIGLQTLPLPWDDAHTALVVSAAGPVAVQELVDCEQGILSALRGSADSLTGCDEVSVLAGSDAPVEPTRPVRARWHRWLRKFYWPLLSLVAALLALFLMLRYLARDREAQRRGREQLDSE